MKNKLQRIKEYVRAKGERGSGLIQFLIEAIIVAFLLYILLVVVKALFFSS
jgi:hypothetical protein